jgi:hypothetical protein
MLDEAKVRDKMRNKWGNVGNCPQCGRFKDHTISCIACPADLKEVLYQKMLDREHWMKSRILKAMIESEIWQGKFRTVKHENNQLRKKLKRQGSEDA